jgi:hypothetical protein
MRQGIFHEQYQSVVVVVTVVVVVVTENLRRLSIGKGGLVLSGSGMGIFLLLSVSSVRNREP